MAKNSLTPEQDLLTRKFYMEVAENSEILLPDSPVSGRTLRGILLQLLNYDQLPNGAFVEKGTPISRPFGSTDYSKYENEWEKDSEAARKAARKTTNTPKASTSKPSKSSSLWSSLFPKDV